MTCLVLALEVNAVYSISATSASLIQRCWSSSKIALVYLIGVHACGSMVVIALRTAESCRAVIEEAALVPARGCDHLMAVERGVRPQHPDPARAGGLGGDQRIGDQPGRALRAAGRAFAQPGRGDHRRRTRRAHGRDQRVQTLGAGVAATGSLLGVAVGLTDGVVDVDVGQLAGSGQQRRSPGQVDQQSGRDRVELPDMAEGEVPQERPQRRGRPNPVEEPTHPAMT